MTKPISLTAPAGAALTAEQVAGLIARACPPDRSRDKRLLLIIPDGTRTMPMPMGKKWRWMSLLWSAGKS